MSVEQFLEVARGRSRRTPVASGPRRWVYCVGWTHHSVGVQYIRTAAILQMLLGNMGRPGGGIMALRGHASIQGSTDIPTLFDLLPGYLPMPQRGPPDSSLDRSVAHPGAKGFWGNADAYAVSLLKAYWGDAATAENDFAYDYMPRMTGDHGTYRTVLDMIDGKVRATSSLGQNPAVGSAHGSAQRLGMANLDWLVVRDLHEIESATFWKDSPEVDTGEIVTEECGTEVFLMPAASHVEKEGTFTQTQRLLQWRREGGRAHRGPPLGAVVLLPPRPPGPGEAGRLHRPRGPAAARPRLGLPDSRPDDGAQRRGRAQRSTATSATAPAALVLHGAARRRLHRGRLLDLHRRLRRRRQPGRPAQARHRAVLGGAGVGLGVAGEPAHPLQPRLRRPRRAALERAQGVRVVGRAAGRWTGHDVPDFEPTKAPSYRPPEGASGVEALAASTPSSCRPTARVPLRAPGPRRRAAAHALRAGRVAGRQPAVRPAGQPRPASSTAERRTRINPARRATARSSRTCSPPAG